MSVTEILQLADRLILKQEGRNLDEIEELIIKGTWENKTYQEISEECDIGESRVRNIGSKLWNILSESLGTSINKDNFRSIFKRLKNIQLSQNICNTGDNFHFSQILYNSTKQYQKNDNNTQSKLSHHDLTLAPQIINFHNRETELQTLTHWILNQNTHLISMLGLSGIGKTTLVKRFIDLHQQKFDAIVWRSLKLSESSSKGENC
jgi:signal recognition particle GTPase